MKKVKDYLKSKYQILAVRGNRWELNIESSISKQEKKRLEDVLELDVKAELEMSKIRVVLHV